MKEWFYQHKEYGLCLTWKPFKQWGVSADTLSQASIRNTKAWAMIDHPHQKKAKIIVWELLGEKQKEIVLKHIGDPIEYFIKQPIRNLIEADAKAEEYFRTELLAKNASDLQQRVTKYTRQASVLNLLVKAERNKDWLNQELGISFKKLKQEIACMNDEDRGWLPKNLRVLERHIQDYKQHKYEWILDDRLGNRNSTKIGKTMQGFDEELREKQEAVIRKCASHPNNFNTAQITSAVNKLFASQNWPVVSESTVYNVLKRNEYLTTAGRRGKREYSDKISMHVKRRRPELPLQYFTLDGWTVELAYKTNDGGYSRFVLVVVLDVMNNYPVGYAIGERESAELIQQASRNAILHIQELFGAPYRPWQIQSDRFALKKNTPFFEAMSYLFTPAAAGNAKAKVIEPYFKYLQSTYFQYLQNWTGHNVNAKKDNQPNREFKDKIKNTFPNRDGVLLQIETIMQRERKGKQAEYIAKFNAMDESEKVTLERKDWLMVFGKPTGYTNSITGTGLITTIQGNKLVYDSFEPEFRSLKHIEWKVIYDECDLNSILVISSDDRHRFVLEQKREIPMDVRSMSTEDHEYLGRIRRFNKNGEAKIMQTYIQDAAVVEEVLNNTLELDAASEFVLKSMFTYNGQQKEALQDAKGLKGCTIETTKTAANKSNQEAEALRNAHFEYLKSKTDINKYLD